MKLIGRIACLFCVLMLATCVGAQTLRVAAAADLQYAMQNLVDQFEAKTGTTVSVAYGSSGNFRAQIENGAPFDVFFSADEQYPQALVQAGAAGAQSLTVYAQGHLVLWATNGEKLALKEKGLRALQDFRVNKIAIANPEHAPYGRAAIAALRKAGLYDQLKSKLVYGENISQAAQFAESGSAEVGIIALSLTLADSMKSGEWWEVPSDLYPPILQEAVIISASHNKRDAKAFLAFVTGESGRATLARYGLAPPPSGAKP